MTNLILNLLLLVVVTIFTFGVIYLLTFGAYLWR